MKNSNFGQTKTFLGNYIISSNSKEKEEIDAETLCSQIAKQMGINSPIYFAVEKNGNLFSMCNSVFEENDVKNFLSKMFNKESENKICALKVAVGACVGDVFLEKENAYKNELLSFSTSGKNFLTNGDLEQKNGYYSSFSSQKANKVEIVQQLVYGGNKMFLQNFLKNLNKIDVFQISNNLKTDLNYETSQNYVKFLNENINNFKFLVEEMQNYRIENPVFNNGKLVENDADKNFFKHLNNSICYLSNSSEEEKIAKNLNYQKQEIFNQFENEERVR